MSALAQRASPHVDELPPARRPTGARAWLCYSIGLAELLKGQVECGRAGSTDVRGLYAELGAPGTVEPGAPDHTDCWDQEFPRLMAEVAADVPEKSRFDSFIVDEAKDFADLVDPAPASGEKR